MPALKPQDHYINCGPRNPFTMVKRGPIKVRYMVEDVFDPCSDFYVEVRCGRRRQRTGFYRYYQQAEAMGDVLTILGFDPAVTIEKVNYDTDYSESPTE